MSRFVVVTGSSKGVGLEISRTPGPLKGLDGFEWCECDFSEADQIRYATECSVSKGSGQT